MKLNSRVKVLCFCMAFGVLAASIWAGFSGASNSAARTQEHSALTVNPLSVFVSDTTVLYIDSQKYNVAPGDSVSGSAYCPKDRKGLHAASYSYYVEGGGYVVGGEVGLSIASATAAYPTTASNGYRVVVSNPKAASGDVNFIVRASCLVVESDALGE